MFGRNNIGKLLTKLPTHTKLTLSIIGVAFLSHCVGKQSVNRSKETNFKRNLNELNGNSINFKCFYTAKQYHEECNDINRYRGLKYINNICNDLENKLNKCKNDLYGEISDERSFSMDPLIAVRHRPKWLQDV
ncbi:conserved hypothetical protein [Theileria orientalis strain Shintoku]|uniref:Uncharacterized protein n=1 Tax=Theileria orientalis strain Shintoku TaxID=869250 RepID=J7MBZ3_THEOR|nr:conserved hypothetical protein [Theileria orientalis strain Shintoku]BAM38687.1 conserved hypothetical protein [Theileria orientalis strain Shintoku]|eukprot:XP_009688988.1 conserved hypothetical protein [Theileria orientalis strain Shintoku]